MSRPQTDDDTRKCFNTPNSWQLGWYQDARISLNMDKRGAFRGNLLGVNDYKKAGNNDYVGIRIEAPGGRQRGLTENYFVGFNVKRGINSDTTEDGNLITVHSQMGENGSNLLRLLSQRGDSFQANNWTLNVLDVDLSANPPFAQIEINKNGCSLSDDCNESCNECCTDSDCDAPRDDCVVATCYPRVGCQYDNSACPGTFIFSLTTGRYCKFRPFVRSFVRSFMLRRFGRSIIIVILSFNLY